MNSAVLIVIVGLISMCESRKTMYFTIDRIKVTCTFAEDFKNFMSHFYPHYTPDETYGERLESFKNCMESVCSHDPTTTGYSKSYTKFCFMSKAEREMVLNAENNRAEMSPEPHKYEEGLGQTAGNYSWVDTGKVAGIKDQGICGNCYAFAAAGAVESHFVIKCGKLYDLSPQHYTDCAYGFGTSQCTSTSCINNVCTTTTFDKWKLTNGNNKGCNGGDFRACWAYQNLTGSSLSYFSAYPSISSTSGASGKCNANGSTPVYTSNYVRIPANDEATLLKTIQTVGPVACAIDATNLDSYAGGIYDSPNSLSTNHAILVVGYGSDSLGNTYWIIKNSWGTSWGNNGYFLLKRGTNSALIASSCAYPILSGCPPVSQD